MRYTLVPAVLAMLLVQASHTMLRAQPYRTLEVRMVSGSAKANGETDFKGPTEVLDTEQRIGMLGTYANFAAAFFDDKELNKQPVSVEQAKQAVAGIKPQPLPQVRLRTPLNQWQYIGYSPDKAAGEQANLAYWSKVKGVVVDKQVLRWTQTTKVQRTFEPIDWRGRLVLDINTPNPKALRLTLGQAVVLTNLPLAPGQWHRVEVEWDLDIHTQGYNVYVDHVKVTDYAPVAGSQPVAALGIEATTGTLLDNVVVTRYGRKEYGADLHDRDEPYTIATVLDDTFGLTPNPQDCSLPSYDSQGWLPVPEMPFAYGGERFKGERLYLRTVFDAPQGLGGGNYEQVVLNVEAISPSGEVWINGRVVHLAHKPTPVQVDITPYIVAGRNVVAMVVDPRKVEVLHRHTAADLYTGWYAGRAWVDYRSKDYLQRPYVVTTGIQPDTAHVAVHFNVNSTRWLKAEREVKVYNGFTGTAEVALYEWFPAEHAAPVAVVTIPIESELYEDKAFTALLQVQHPQLWSVEQPQLYRVAITLRNTQGQAVDDLVLTTGLRTLSQEGGTFRINGQPAMMNGALILGHRAPLENVARHMYCAPSYIVMQDILKIKGMNGNTIRMSHHDQVTGGTNDPRYAEYADQLGLMYQWATPAWVRSGSPWLLDFEALPSYVEQVRNHPSIVMWQPANHPKVGPPIEKSMEWFAKVYHAIWSKDSSRLISPTANQIRMDGPSDDGTVSFDGKPATPFAIWTAPMVTRGNMDHITGYGANWEGLRLWPRSKKWDGEQGWRADANRGSYLQSPYRAYFDFENEESIGQPNWSLQQGKPEYLIMSYELDMDKGSIGRLLTTQEWRESQAYQAMSAFEAIKKKRMLDYDGFAWCELNGGGNSGTYLKPVLDYYDHAKLAYYALTMAYQPSFACSDNVDMVYGPADTVGVVVVHLGGRQQARVQVLVKNQRGELVMQQQFDNIILPAGRNVVPVGHMVTSTLPEGHYAFEYYLKTF